MTRRKPYVVQRMPIFVGCEGESEAGYAGLLDLIAKAAELPVHLHIERLAPAGDPLARVERAINKMGRMQGRREPFKHRFILLDTDQNRLAPERAAQARRLARNEGIKLVWQEPCFEALLLRHFPGCAAHRPVDNIGTMQALEREWPNYAKPQGRTDLARRIDREAILRAASVEPDLADMLRVIGLLA